MRQMISFVKRIQTRLITDQYYHNKFFAGLHKFELNTSLEEILGVTSEDDKPAFDKKTDAVLERRALELLERAKKRV